MFSDKVLGGQKGSKPSALSQRQWKGPCVHFALLSIYITCTGKEIVRDGNEGQLKRHKD